MEQSAFEALTIGVSVFVFIIALTAGVLLMSNVIDMVNYANEQAIVGMNGTLAESVGVVNERIYTGSQLLTYYRQQVQAIEQEKEASEYEFRVKLSKTGSSTELKAFVQRNTINNYLHEEFLLEYRGVNENKKQVYVFVRKY